MKKIILAAIAILCLGVLAACGGDGWKDVTYEDVTIKVPDSYIKKEFDNSVTYSNEKGTISYSIGRITQDDIDTFYEGSLDVAINEIIKGAIDNNDDAQELEETIANQKASGVYTMQTDEKNRNVGMWSYFLRNGDKGYEISLSSTKTDNRKKLKKLIKTTTIKED